jgi:hypothetical protein
VLVSDVWILVIKIGVVVVLLVGDVWILVVMIGVVVVVVVVVDVNVDFVEE